MDNYIYMDYAATTPIDYRVQKVMLEHLKKTYGNPSSIYRLGQQTKNIIDECRLKIAKALNVSNKEIYFTSGGTESNNWAIQGIINNQLKKNQDIHMITSQIEHKSVLNTCKSLEEKGVSITYVPVDSQGGIDIQFLEESIQENTVLISIMLANNETGVIQNIKKISNLINGKDICFHTDAIQGIGKLNIDIKELGVDLLSISAHKFYGPKGIGALFIKKGTEIDPLIFGGGQERGLRPGTENIANIIGMTEALGLSVTSIKTHQKTIRSLEDYFIKQLQSNFEKIKINGFQVERLPGYINVAFKDMSNEALLMNLDLRGIYVSSGSACTSGSLKQSHVMKAMGLDKSYGVLRFSLNHENTKDEIDRVINDLKSIIKQLS